MDRNVNTIDSASLPSARSPSPNAHPDSWTLSAPRVLDLASVLGMQKAHFRDMELNVLVFLRDDTSWKCEVLLARKKKGLVLSFYVQPKPHLEVPQKAGRVP